MDPRRTAAAAERNLTPILGSLARHAPTTGRALEIASGSGQQIVQFAARHPGLTWQASDANPDNLHSIIAWACAAPAPNLLPPIVLDASRPGWGKAQAGLSLILMVNLLHLISQPAAEVVLQQAATALRPNGRLMIYGPFLRSGVATSEGDVIFDAQLRSQDPATGYKDLAWVASTLGDLGLEMTVEEMPANNLMLISFNP